MDVRGTRIEQFAELERYCRHVAGSIGRLCLAVFGGADAETTALADDLGVALQLTNILRDVREDALNGRVYLPLEDLRRFGWPAGDGGAAAIVARTGEGAVTDRAFISLLAFETARARQWFERGLALVPLLDRRSGACVLAMSGIYRRLLGRIEADPSGDARAATFAQRAREGDRRGAQPARRERMSATRVAVIGGGVAGITAALDCADAGASVTLLEVRPRLGGAAYSFERDGLMLDNGQHVFLRCCSAYRALLERLGSEPLTALQPRLRIPVLAPGGRTVILSRGNLPAPLHLARSLMRYRHLSRRERLLAAYGALALRRLKPATAARDESRRLAIGWSATARARARSRACGT